MFLCSFYALKTISLFLNLPNYVILIDAWISRIKNCFSDCHIFFFSFLNRGWFYWFYKCKFHWEFEVWFQRRHILFCCFWCILPDGLWCIGWCKYERWPERTQSKYTRRLSSRSWFMVRICSYMNSLHNVFIFSKREAAQMF